jgi:hypothetical protein
VWSPSMYLYTVWCIPYHLTHPCGMPTLWQGTLHFSSSWHVVWHSWRWLLYILEFQSNTEFARCV